MRLFRLLFLGWAGLVLSGCAGYRLGPLNGLAPGEKSLQIIPFLNQTLEPRLADALTAALRREVQRDGTFRLATRDAGDVVVSGVITNYDRHELSFVSTDVTTARDYRISLTARIVARDRGTGKVLLDRTVAGTTLIRVGPDLASTERQALPSLADDLAKNAVALLVEGNW